MADVKWIKLATALPDNRKIKQIRHLPNGDTIALMWIFLMCLAGETNDEGMVYFMPEIPYTEEMLADQFSIDVNTVRLGLATFQRFGMIEIIDDIICLPTWEKWQAVDKLSAMREQTRKRVAKHREKQRALMEQNQCQYCGDSATGYDHIIATARGGTDTDENKVPCCAECNRIKNDKPLVDFLNFNRDRIDDDLVASNAKLQRYVTLCNVTGRYIVTQSNATDIDIDKDKELEEEIINNVPDSDESARSASKPNKADINAFFDSVWQLYPVKKGKGQVSDTKRKALYAIGYEEISRAIGRYLQELKRDSDWRKPQNGSTFFNSGYVDYLDDNFVPDEPRKDGVKQHGTDHVSTSAIAESIGTWL